MSTGSEDEYARQVAEEQARWEARRQRQTQRIIYMTAEQHIVEAARLLTAPVNRSDISEALLTALVHAQLAVAKQGQP
jgi:hypothetical protein